jgi:hypothetical protein
LLHHARDAIEALDHVVARGVAGPISHATAYPLQVNRTLADLRVPVDSKAQRCSRSDPAGDGVVVNS